MKKFLKIALCLIVCVGLMVPAFLLSGCGKGETAKSVRNSTYYITVATRDYVQDETIINAKFRINFFDEHFKVEYGDVGTAAYGYYIGTYDAKVSEVDFTITEYGGAFSEGKVDSDLVLSKLKFSKGVLSIEFIGKGGKIIQFEFEQRED